MIYKKLIECVNLGIIYNYMKVLRFKIKFQILSMFLIIFGLIFLQSCKNRQDELFNKFQNDFSNSIQKSNAKKFEYQYDGLSPQNSYFVGCKLQYLTLKSSGELTTTEEFVIFENDSINKIIKRIQIYEENERGRDWSEIETDSIYVTDFKKGITEIYAKNEIVKTVNTKDLTDNNKYIYMVKEQTEINYNCK